MQPQQVTQWPERLALTVVVLAIIGLAVWGMWRGWRNRARRQQFLAEPAGIPSAPADVRLEFPGRYVATVIAPDWLDRVVAHGLGAPGRADVTVRSDGVLIDREGASALFIPAVCIVTAEPGTGLAGEVVERDGLLVITWRLGDVEVATGVRADRAADQRAAMGLIASLPVTEGAT